jgi:hypothetical protein
MDKLLYPLKIRGLALSRLFQNLSFGPLGYLLHSSTFLQYCALPRGWCCECRTLHLILIMHGTSSKCLTSPCLHTDFALAHLSLCADFICGAQVRAGLPNDCHVGLLPTLSSRVMLQTSGIAMLSAHLFFAAPLTPFFACGR